MHKYPKIRQFRHAVDFAMLHNIQEVVFSGTTKIHGSNTSVVFSPEGNIKYCQSRNTIITKDDDFMGFAKWVETRRVTLEEIAKATMANKSNGQNEDIVVFGEWCGPGVQKGTAVNSAPQRMWWIFEGCLSGTRESILSKAVFVDKGYEYQGVYYTPMAGVTNINIRFTEDVGARGITETTKLLESLVQRVEQQCPVGKYLGLEGIGEGLVFSPVAVFGGDDLSTEEVHAGLRFKVKGEKHKATKSGVKKELSAADKHRKETITRLAEKFVSDVRLEQAFQYLCETNDILPAGGLEKKNIGAMIRWVIQDVLTEEEDVFREMSLEESEINGPIARLVSTWVTQNCGKKRTE